MAKKHWIYTKRGLSEDPKHRVRLGECIWLFLHMIDRADWETGIVYDWKDEQEAADMAMPVPTLRHQRRKMQENKYITCIQRQQSQAIIIHNWVNPKDYSSNVINPRQGDNTLIPQEENQGNNEGDNQGDNHVSGQIITPSLSSESKSESNDDEEDIKIKTGLLLSKLNILFPPVANGTLAIKNEYLKHGPDFILGYISKTYQDGRKLREPLAFLAARLKGIEPPDAYYLQNFRTILPDEYLEAIGLAEYSCSYCYEKFSTRDLFEAHTDKSHLSEETEEAEEDQEEITPVMIGALDGSRVWKSILTQLQEDMPRASFESWVKDTRPVSFDNGHLNIQTHGRYARDWLEDRLLSTVNRLIVGVANRGDISINFVCRE